MTKKSKADKLLDNQIEQIFYKHCSGIQINIMDVSKVFAEGKKAAAEGRDLTQAIVSFVDTIRKN